MKKLNIYLKLSIIHFATSIGILYIFLLGGCASMQEFDEEVFRVPALYLHCYSQTSLSSHKDIRKGKALGIAQRKNGVLSQHVPCAKISGKLYFLRPDIEAHEYQEILAQIYPDKWLNPDKIMKFQSR